MNLLLDRSAAGDLPPSKASTLRLAAAALTLVRLLATGLRAPMPDGSSRAAISPSVPNHAGPSLFEQVHLAVVNGA